THEAVRCVVAFRPLDHSPFQATDKRRLEILLPHLRCAQELSAEVAAHNSDVLLGLIGIIPEPLLIVDEVGRLVLLNAPAERLVALKEGLVLAHGRIVASSPADTDTIRKRIAEAASGDGPSPQGVELIAVTRPPSLPLALRIAPIGHPIAD